MEEDEPFRGNVWFLTKRTQANNRDPVRMQKIKHDSPEGFVQNNTPNLVATSDIKTKRTWTDDFYFLNNSIQQQ